MLVECGMKRVSIFVIIVLLLGIFCLPARVSAQSTSDLTLGYAPHAFYPTLKPGEVFQNKIVFWNVGDITKDYDIIISGIRNANNQAGTAVPLTKSEDAVEPFTASSWITVDKSSFTLAPQMQIEINFTIRIPEDVVTGGYYGVVMAVGRDDLLKPLDQTASIAKLGAGSVMVINVDGGQPIQEQAQVQDFRTDKPYYFEGTTQFITTIENQGNVNLFPKGKIIIRNIFQQKVAEIELTDNTITLLRGKLSNILRDWNDNFVINKDKWVIVGPMTAELLLIYSTQNPGFSTLQAYTTFWMLPWPVLVGLAVIILFIILKRRKRKRPRYARYA